MKKTTALLSLALTYSTLSFAAPFPSNSTILKSAPYPKNWSNEIKPIKWAPTSIVERMKAQEKSRKVASDLDQEFFENKMSKEFKKFRDEFLKIKTADELDAKLVELDKNYDKLPTDLKFVASQLVPMRALRGIVWKLTPTVEDTKIAHSLLVTQVKALAVNLKIFLPTEQWNAAFDYISKPFVEDGNFPFTHSGELSKQFARGSEVQVQAYVRNFVVPMLKKSTERLEALDLGDDGVVWDNKFLYGSGSFPSAMDRYALVGEVERHISLMHMYGGLSETMYQSAYSMEGSLKLNKDISKLYGMDAFLSQVDGVPASKRVAVIRNPSYGNWGKLYQDGQEWLNSSWYYLGQAVNHGDIAWTGLKDRNVSEIYFADNSYALPFQRPINLRFDNLKRMMDGETKIRSFITDETTTVNLKAFYLNPPTDLKELYGTQFESGDEMLSMKLQTKSGPTTVKYRNYLRGRPVNWKIEQFQKYFPSVKNGNDLQNTARILSQGWGSFVVSMPLSSYLN